ncbi:MAG: DUF814 domain-containing protein [Deltaproteobacteria bacterium]|nr:DUF814 domain-containing protein [Deltaproteobacteria bacterium]
MSPREERAVKPSDPEAGVYRGRAVARRFTASDGTTVLVGKNAADNDVLTFQLASPRDFWLHVAAESGSHVVIRNPDGRDRPSREALQLAASLAAGHSRAREGGRVAVHLARRSDVSKPRGFAPGKVLLSRYRTVHAAPRREPEGDTST